MRVALSFFNCDGCDSLFPAFNGSIGSQPSQHVAFTLPSHHRSLWRAQRQPTHR